MCFQAESSNRKANSHTSYPLICATAPPYANTGKPSFFFPVSVIVPKANCPRAQPCPHDNVQRGGGVPPQVNPSPPCKPQCLLEGLTRPDM